MSIKFFNTLTRKVETIIPNEDVDYYWYSDFIKQPGDRTHLGKYERQDNSVHTLPPWNFIATLENGHSFTLPCPYSSHGEYSENDVVDALIVPVKDGARVVHVDTEPWNQQPFAFSRTYPFVQADQIVYYKFTGVKRIILHCAIAAFKKEKTGLMDMAPNPFE